MIRLTASISIGMYLAAFVAANLFVKHFGEYGLWFSSLFLIPFDFICRCLFHETWTGKKLLRNLTILTLISSIITIILNRSAINIALGSMAGFTMAQITAGIFYQKFINKSIFLKVNGSDLIAICFDSLFFQWVAFGGFNWKVTAGQIVVKFIGGLIWYLILFKNEKARSV